MLRQPYFVAENFVNKNAGESLEYTQLKNGALMQRSQSRK